MGRLRWIRTLRGRFHSEREVETDIILTVAEHLGFAAQYRAVGYTIPGSRRQADVVLFATEDHVPEAALVVFEAKKPDNPQDPLPQAHDYAHSLGAPFYATCNGEQLAVYRLSDDRLQFAVVELAELEDRWDSLEALLHRSVLIESNPDRTLPDAVRVRAAQSERMYRSGCQRRYNNLQVFRRHEGLDLRSLYVPTRMARVRDIPPEPEPRAGSAARHAPRPRASSQEFGLAEQLLGRGMRWVVIGDPGAGKSTLMRYLTTELAIPGMESVIPVYISLNDLFRDRRQDDDRPIEEYFFQYFQRDVQEFAVTRGDVWLRQWLEEGRAALLWDGLDEVTGFSTAQEGNVLAAEQALGLIRRLSERYREAAAVVTSRRGAWQHRVGNLPPDFVVYETVPFQSEDIERFIRGWFSRKPGKGEQLLEALKINPAANQLAGNPLLLTFMTYRYELTGELPDRDRYSIFNECVRLLLREWDEDPSRRVQRRSVLNAVPMRRLLGELGLSLHVGGNRFTSRRELESLVGSFVERIPGGDLQHTPEIVDHDLESKYGLVRQYIPDQYGFLHHSLQEFLAAEAIDQRHWEEWWPERLLQHVGDPWWDEVLVHLAGGNHSQQLIAALSEGPDDIFHTGLFLAGRCLAGARSSQVDVSLQTRVIDRLAEVMRDGIYGDAWRAASTLAEIGTDAALDRLLEGARVNSWRDQVPALWGLARLRHPEVARLACTAWLKGKGWEASELICQHAGPSEVAMVAARAREEVRRGTYDQATNLLSEVRSRAARGALLGLVANAAEPAAIRMAAALAVGPNAPGVRDLWMACWGTEACSPLAVWMRAPGALLRDLLDVTDLQAVPVAYLQCLARSVRPARLAPEELERLRLDAAPILRGRVSHRQERVAHLLAAAGDIAIRQVARRWLGQKRRSRVALDILARYWPEDLLDFTGSDSLNGSHIWALARHRGELLLVGLKVLEAWWHRGIVPKGSEAHKALVAELVDAGVHEAVADYCEVARGEGYLLGPNHHVMPVLLKTASGRAFVDDVLESRIPWGPEQQFYLIALAAEQDEQLAQRALTHLLSLDPQPANAASYRFALSRVARKLDLFLFRGPDGRITCGPRRNARGGAAP